MEKYINIVDIVKKKFENSKKSHDWEHTERVFKLCQHIKNTVEEVNNDILTLAAILHDIGREEQDNAKGKVCHAKVGAEIARQILEENNISKDIVEGVVHCIETHRYRGDKEPESIEAKILYDADKLDSIGAVGIGRAFVFAGEIGAKVHNKGVDISKTKSYTEEDTAYREFMVKLKFIKKKMMTEEGKRLAKERHKFMKKFFKRLDMEVDGEL